MFTKQVISEYQFLGKEPLCEELFQALEVKPKLLERKRVFERVVGELTGFVHTFEDYMGMCRLKPCHV